MLAVIMATDDPERLYVAFSLLVSTAVEGEEAHGLLTRPALRAFPLLDPEMWATVQETDVRLYGCDPGPFETSSIPRFLKATSAARLVVV